MKRDKAFPLWHKREGVFIKGVRGISVVILLISIFSLITEAQPLPVVREIQIQGNKYVEERKIRKVVKSKIGEPLSEKSVREDMESIYQMGLFS
ncbi:MAG: POTRA domain-containing protein, partial [Candidatus Aerophobetes bacterium]|nr:POTRA domain-containing protein [Candidatus Aerophobetes bacterium]